MTTRNMIAGSATKNTLKRQLIESSFAAHSAIQIIGTTRLTILIISALRRVPSAIYLMTRAGSGRFVIRDRRKFFKTAARFTLKSEQSASFYIIDKPVMIQATARATRIFWIVVAAATIQIAYLVALSIWVNERFNHIKRASDRSPALSNYSTTESFLVSVPASSGTR